jgi:flagellar biosynthesis protein FliR
MARILLVMLIFSFIYSIVGIVFSTSGKTVVFVDRSNVEYIKISLQCILGLGVLFLPSALEHKLKITFSNEMHILFVLFLYGAIILGEVQGFYRRFYHWDTLLHTLSGVMLSSFGFCIIDIINKSEKINLGLSDWFMSFFSFCFAIMLDTIWEIIEFIMDTFMDLNMQQYILPDGTILIGHYAVIDTMKDLIVDALGALVISIIGYILLKRRKNIIVNNIENEKEENI